MPISISIVLGIRDYSRELEFKSSYTLTEHAPLDSLRTEIIPRALRKSAAWSPLP